MNPNWRAVEMRYGRERATICVPAHAEILTSAWGPPLPDPDAALIAALEHPIGTPPLLELLRRRRPRTLAISISDITRPVPNQRFLPMLLDLAVQAGIDPANVTVVIGTGMHRPSTSDEILELVGPDVLAACNVVEHRADVPTTLVTVSENPPVRICRVFAEADFRIVTGLIEPHFMAGFSGGRKGVCPALVDLATIQRFHGYDTLSDPLADSGVLEGNPCHQIALDVARQVGVDFLLNVAITQDRQLAGFFCGDLEQAHAEGCRAVSTWARAEVETPYDLVVTCGGGYPLDQTLYQTVKGMCAALPALGPHSTLLQLSHCGEGIGSQSYRELLLHYGQDWRRFLDDIRARRDRTQLDQWEFQVQCRVLERIGVTRLLLATDGIERAALKRLALQPVPGPGPAATRTQEYIETFTAAHPAARIAVIPDGPYTLVVRQ